MKKKLSVGLILAMVFVMLAAVGLALGLRYSPKAAAVLTAREALMKEYGLTQDMVRLFGTEHTEIIGDKTITTFSCGVKSAFTNGEAMGKYTVTEDKNGGKTVEWSHDNVDKALWQNGDLTSPVWGAEQLQQAIDRYALYDAWHKEHIDISELPQSEQDALYDELAALVAPLVLERSAPMTSLQEREQSTSAASATPTAMPEATPLPTARPNDISSEEAIQIARQAMVDAYKLTEAELNAFENEVWYQFENADTCLVMFYGTETMGHVMLDSVSGEVESVMLDSAVGGNG